MAVRIAQDATYVGDDRWKWSVWIDGNADELGGIEFVQYTLHHTFPNPVRRIDNRSTMFRLDSSGWGTFMLYAKVVRTDGTTEALKHYLQLYYPSGEPTLA